MMTPKKRAELMAKVPENVREMLEEQERIKEERKKERSRQQYQKALENQQKWQESQTKIKQKVNPFINKSSQPVINQSSQSIVNHTPQPIVNQSQSNTNQLENKAIYVDNIPQQLEDINTNQEVINNPKNQSINKPKITLKLSNNYTSKNELIINQEIEQNNDLTDEEKEQLKTEINNRLIWIRMSLTAEFYTDKEGNIPLFWQREAKKYLEDNFTGREYQEIIDTAISFLTEDEKLLFNQLLNYQDEIQVNQLLPVTNLDHSLSCPEYLEDPEVEQEFNFISDNQDDNLTDKNNLPKISCISDNQDDSLTDNNTLSNQKEINTDKLNNNQSLPDNLSDNIAKPFQHQRGQDLGILVNNPTNPYEEMKKAELDNNEVKTVNLDDNLIKLDTLTDTVNQPYQQSFTNSLDNLPDTLNQAHQQSFTNSLDNLPDTLNQAHQQSLTNQSDTLKDTVNQPYQQTLTNQSDTLKDTINQLSQKSFNSLSDSNQISYQLIEDDEELKNEIALLSQEKILAIDTETTGLDPHIHKIRLIQIASYNHPTILIDCFKCSAKLIQPILINDSIKVLHNAKFDLQFFFALGLEVNQSIFDTMLAHQLVTAGNSNVKASLKAIASQYLKIELNKDEQVSDWKSDKLSDTQLEYAVKDAEVLLPLREKLREEILNYELTRVAKIEFDCIHAVAMMEFNGMLLDVGKWQEILKETIRRKEELATQLQFLLPHDNSSQFSLDFTIFNSNNNSDSINNNKENNFSQSDNINSNSSKKLSHNKNSNLTNNNQGNFNQFSSINLDSSKQLLEALNRAGIEVKDTNSKTLKKLLTKYPEIINPLLEYKKVSKLISSFGDSLLKKINLVTGRLHGSYWQLGSQSGRFTSSDPNLQQIPRNQETRSCFVASPSYKLVIADYSQIELRIASELTKDKTMIEAYNNGEDLHKLTASIVLNKPLNEVSKEDRQLAKACNFGLIYGQSVNGFRSYAESNYGVTLSEKEAKKIIDNFFKSYQGLAKWHKQTKTRIYNQGIDETRTLSGRIRYFDNPSPQQVLNTPVQGLGADMVKLALGKLVTALKGYDCRILATVHDEIILEAHESIALEVAKILSEVMVSSGKGFLKLVPVEAEASIGDNWADK